MGEVRDEICRRHAEAAETELGGGPVRHDCRGRPLDGKCHVDLVVYIRKREYLHSNYPKSVPLAVDGRADIHNQIHVTFPIQRASSVVVADRAAPSSVSAASACRRHISSLTSPIRRA